MLKLTYYKNGEKGSINVLNRPLKEITNQIGDVKPGKPLTKSDILKPSEINNSGIDDKLITGEILKMFQAGTNYYIGKIEMHSFRKEDLPSCWCACDGSLYDITSKQGKALLSINDDIKTRYGIKVTGTKINSPKLIGTTDNNLVISSNVAPTGIINTTIKNGNALKTLTMLPAIYVGE